MLVAKPQPVVLSLGLPLLTLDLLLGEQNNVTLHVLAILDVDLIKI